MIPPSLLCYSNMNPPRRNNLYQNIVLIKHSPYLFSLLGRGEDEYAVYREKKKKEKKSRQQPNGTFRYRPKVVECVECHASQEVTSFDRNTYPQNGVHKAGPGMLTRIS